MNSTSSWSLTAGETARVVGGSLVRGSSRVLFTEVSTDSRTLRPGALFVALRGDRFDGHDFIPQAVARGAHGILARVGTSRRLTTDESVAVIEVEDTLYSLGELARHWRGLHPVPLLAVTGSNGKTTTKEMVASILSLSRETLKNEGNWNNRIGLPLTLLRLGPAHGSAVVEMGMNEPGEIRRLCEIAQPQFGLITQVAPAHLEGVGSLEGVARAKGELFESLGTEGTAVVNLDDPWIRGLAEHLPCRSITFGTQEEATVRLLRADPYRQEGARLVLSFPEGHQETVDLGCHGLPGIRCALAASSAAWAMGASKDHIVRGLREFRPLPGRFQVISLARGVHLIDDTYNANPASMEAALEALRSMGRGRLVAVLGDMRELGSYAPQAHRRVGMQAAAMGVDVLIFVGEWASEMAAGAASAGTPPSVIQQVPDAREAARVLLDLHRPGDWILIKGSRAVGLEIVVEALREAAAEGRKQGHAAESPLPTESRRR